MLRKLIADLIEEIMMQTTRLYKQHMNQLSSLPMSFDSLRANFGLFGGIMGTECPDYNRITIFEEKYYAKIRQSRCRNGG